MFTDQRSGRIASAMLRHPLIWVSQDGKSDRFVSNLATHCDPNTATPLHPGTNRVKVKLRCVPESAETSGTRWPRRAFHPIALPVRCLSIHRFRLNFSITHTLSNGAVTVPRQGSLIDLQLDCLYKRAAFEQDNRPIMARMFLVPIGSGHSVDCASSH